MTEKKVLKKFFIVKNDKGLHTRPATEIVKCLAKFKSNITLQYGELTVNAKSLLGVMMLAAECGAKVNVEVTGEDAKECLKTLLELAEQKFYMKY
jgi:phosphocarrier protein HPr